MNSYRIAVIPGDGVGKEISEEAIRILNTASEIHGFEVETKTFEPTLMAAVMSHPPGPPIGIHRPGPGLGMPERHTVPRSAAIKALMTPTSP